MNGRVSRRAFGAGIVSAGLLGDRALAEDTPRRGGRLVATWGGGEPQACYVPSGGGPAPTLTSSKVLERLARRLAHGHFVGELAEDWTPAPDFRSYAIRIRQGVTFHDGRPMTVDDVVYSIDEVWRKHAAPASLVDCVGVAAPDTDRVVVTFARPVPAFYFAALLSGPVNYIVPRHVYAGSDPAANPANDAPIGTGPWKFGEWVRGSHIAYVRNDTYWRPERPYLDRLTLRFVRDPAGRAAAMEAGDIRFGVANPVALPDIKRLVAGGRFVASARGYEDATWTTTLECNLRHPLLARREVRQAMFLAVDRGLIAKTVYYGYARPGTGPICSSNATYFSKDTVSTAFDPKKAAALLDTAGLTKKADGRRFTVRLLAAGWFAENARVGAIVKQGLEDVGVAVSLATPDRATSLRRLYTDYDFDLAISNQLCPPEPVPETTRYFTSDGIRRGVPFHNASGFHSAAVDGLVERIRVETDPAERRALMAEFQKVVSFEAPLLPLVELETVTLADRQVRQHDDDRNILAASWHDLWLADGR